MSDSDSDDQPTPQRSILPVRRRDGPGLMVPRPSIPPPVLLPHIPTPLRPASFVAPRRNVLRRATNSTPETPIVMLDLSEPTNPFVLPTDPMEAREINARYRRADVPDGIGSDLWTIDQVAQVFPKEIQFTHTTFAPIGWKPATKITQSMYYASFAAKFPIVSSVLPISNVIIAGGSAAWALGDTTFVPGDFDFFIHGIDPTNNSALWNKVGEVVEKIKDAAKKVYEDVDICLSPGVVTMIAHNSSHGESAKREKFQIILRAYSTVSSILHGFDLPSSSVAFDGVRIYTTTLGAFAYVYRANLVLPENRSTTYESRLVKYFKRGYALILPHLKSEKLEPETTLMLPHLSLQIYGVFDKIFAVGDLILPMDAAPAGSDYGAMSYENFSDDFEGMPISDRLNFHNIVTGAYKFCKISYSSAIDFVSYARNGSPALKDILTKDRYMTMVIYAAKNVVKGKRGVVLAISTLRQVFGFTEAELNTFVETITNFRKQYPKSPFNVVPALQPFIDRLRQKYDAAPQQIDWWIIRDPDRQYTSSINPRMEDPIQWYGPAALSETITKGLVTGQILYDVCSSLKKSQKSTSSVYDVECPLCTEKLDPGAPNSIVLTCGHLFHGSRTAECSGLLSWLKDHDTCPTCRKTIPITVEDLEEENKLDYSKLRRVIDINIQW